MNLLAAIRTLCGFIALLFALAAVAQMWVPMMSAGVYDLTGTLGNGPKAALEQTLFAFEHRKGNHITVLIVPSTAPETFEQYGLRAVRRWMLGRKDVDNGALLLIAKDDHKLRIEAGDGLKGVLNDAVCKRIVDEIIVPRLRQGDFRGGIAAGVERMIAVVDGEPLPAPSPSPFDSGNPSTEFNRLQLPPDQLQLPRHRPDDSLVLPPSVTGTSATSPLTATAQIPVPALSARVTDLTGTLGSGQKAALEQTLAAFEQRKGSQIAVLLVPTIAPETIEQYGLRVAEQWKLGRKGVDDGALLLIAKNDRKLRIEAGYGLEGALNDAVCKRIIDEIIAPRFRQGDFYGGIAAGVERMIAVVDGEPLPPPLSNASDRGYAKQPLRHSSNDSPWLMLLIMGPYLLLMAVVVIGILATNAPRDGWHSGSRSGSHGSIRGGGGSFFGGGGGGFSGGGGSFGGGGASGRW